MTISTVRRLRPTLLDRDALTRFFERARGLVPGGETVQRVEVRDGERMAAFGSLDELYAAPHMPDRLTDVSVGFARIDGRAATHAVLLHAIDDRLELEATGDEVWAYGASGALADVIDVYGRREPDASSDSLAVFTSGAAGITAASALAVLALRGFVPAVVVFAILGIAWFAADLVLHEAMRAITPPIEAQPLVLELRSAAAVAPRRTPHPRTLQRAAGIALLAVAALVVGVLVPHVPATWGNL